MHGSSSADGKISLEQSAVERRKHVRHGVTLPGQLMWDKGSSRRPCVIRDISLEGARVDTTFYVAVPPRLFLLEESSGNLFECEVRWQNRREIGLFFIDAGSHSARRELIQQHASPKPKPKR